ncbi:hypothetical protein BCCGELA001_28770 [Bradyrhizobium sp. CCGE-LA001]|nr:hypothetical protein BCCGELA001_28770 [Bradyrhizobium sp. CCGE-LA001]
MCQLRLYTLAKAYFDGALDIVGPLDKAADVLFAVNLASDVRQNLFERLNQLVFRFAKANLPYFSSRFESDPHYSLDAAAYQLFLDRHMQYTCGKFERGNETLDEAQENKFEFIRTLATPIIGKLEGARHLDIGCGWGGLVAYFRDQFKSDSVGNTNSAAMKRYAERHNGLKIAYGDFATLSHFHNRFDLVTVVGMAEHLTPSRRAQLLKIVSGSLRKGGALYFQCIAKPSAWIGGDAYRIAYEDVFPGHFLETPAEMAARFERYGFEIVHSQEDGPDYAKTTALWAQNLQTNRLQISELIGERNFRVMFGYLAFGSKLFAERHGSLMRYLLRRR